MAHVEDRWMKTGPTGRKVKSDRHGTGRRWLAVWTEPDGTRRKKSFTVKDAAQAHLDSIGHEIRVGDYIPATRGSVTVADYAHQWLPHQLHQSPGTLRVIDRVIRLQITPTLGALPIAAVTAMHVQAAVTTWSKTLKPRTVKVAYAYTSMIFRHAAQNRFIKTSPCTGISLPAISPARVEAPTTAMVQGVIDALPEPWNRLALLIAATGMRGGEARGLTADRVAVVKGGARIRVDRQLLTTEPTWGPLKTRYSDRTLGIGPATLDALGPLEQFVVHTHGKPLASTTAVYVWQRHARPLGFGAGWHDLRHYHASVLIAGGSSPVAVARRLGHKDATETLQTYGHMWVDDDDRMRDASDALVSIAAPAQPPPG